MTIDRLLLLPVGSPFGKGWGRRRQRQGEEVRDLIRKILKKVCPRGHSPRGSQSRPRRRGKWGRAGCVWGGRAVSLRQLGFSKELPCPLSPTSLLPSQHTPSPGTETALSAHTQKPLQIHEHILRLTSPYSQSEALKTTVHRHSQMPDIPTGNTGTPAPRHPWRPVGYAQAHRDRHLDAETLPCTRSAMQLHIFTHLTTVLTLMLPSHKLD